MPMKTIYEKHDGHHDCREVLEQVVLALDGELSAEEEKALLHEVETCSCCTEKYDAEKCFKEFLSNRIVQQHPDHSIIMAIKNRIGLGA